MHAVHQLDILPATLCRLFERQCQDLRQVIGCVPVSRTARGGWRGRLRLLPLGKTLRIEEQFVSRMDALELGPGNRLRVAIRMPEHGQSAVRPLDFV
ncbi:MAG: hypothetical protein IPL11_16425 [Candidatus Accumulibacter sp.]|nr:hypothetical protein [Accumulibacter sp.]